MPRRLLPAASCVALAAALVVGPAGCGGDEDGAAPDTSPPSTTVPAASSTTAAPSTPTSAAPAPSTFPTPSTAAPSTPTPSTSAPTASAPAGPAQQVRLGDPDRAVVALSFDAGSDAGSTSTILDTLRSSGVRASFALTGRWIEANPDLARRIVADGHHLMNHTETHPSFTGYSTGTEPLSTARRQAEVRGADETLRRVTGRDFVGWFRPPYGDTDDGVDRDLGAIGYRYDVLWTVDSLGWKGLEPAAITQRTLAGAEPGAILMMHVGSASRDAEALPAIIAGLRARGLTMGPVPAVLPG